MGRTLNYNFYLPDEGDSRANGKAWGSGVNGNFTIIDTELDNRKDSILHGIINADGTIRFASPGVSISKTGTGVYNISYTENFDRINNTLNYSVTANTVAPSTNAMVTYINLSNVNSFIINTQNSSTNIAADAAFSFIVVRPL